MAESAANLTIGQVAEQTGLSVHALRFYEREGLLAEPVRRGRNGHRLYSQDDVEWLTLCTRFRTAGMPLSTIRRYADLVRQGPGHEADHPSWSARQGEDHDRDGLEGEDRRGGERERPAAAKGGDQDAAADRHGAEEPGPGRREPGGVLLLAKVGDQVDGDGGGGRGGSKEPRSQPPQRLVAQRAAQRDAVGPVGGWRRGGLLAWLALEVVGPPAGERGAWEDGEGDEQDGQCD